MIHGFRNFVTIGARARQAEAKSSLTQIYQIRIAQTESGSGVVDVFKDFEFKQGLNRYVVGFSEKCRVGDEILNTSQLKVSQPSGRVTFSPDIESKALEYLKNVPCVEGFPQKWEVFAIGHAIGQPRAEGIPFEFPLDVWKINQDKRIVHMPNQKTEMLRHFGQAMVWMISIFALFTSAALWGWGRTKWQAKARRVLASYLQNTFAKFAIGPFGFQLTAILLTAIFFWNVIEVLRQLQLLFY
jgi:hypothetical protein